MRVTDIPDRLILELLRTLNGSSASRCGNAPQPGNTVIHALPVHSASELILAKMHNMMQRGLVEGFLSGSRADFKITDKGLAELSVPTISETESPHDVGVGNEHREKRDSV